MGMQKLIHKHSNVNTGTPKSPETGVLAKGEIAVNYNNTDPCLFIEKENGAIAKFATESAIQEYINGQNFLTEHQQLKTINGYSIVGSGNINISGGTGGTGGVSQEDFEEHVLDQDIHVKPSQKISWDQKYYKDPNGIPLSDLSNEVKSSLEKANTAIQSVKTVNGNSIVGTGNISVGTVTSVGAVASSGITITGGPITSSGNITIGLSRDVIGQAMITSLVNVPIEDKLILAQVSSNQTLSFSSLPGNGHEIHIIISNTSSNVINITLPSSRNYVCTSSNVIYIGGNKYGEVNLVVIGGYGYIRGVSSI